MFEVPEKLDWIPLEIDSLMTDEAWKWCDFEFGWYMRLLVSSCRSKVRGHLEDDGQLWVLAGARTKRYFDENSARVLSRFKTTTVDGRRFIYNEKLLKVLWEQSHRLGRKNLHELDELALSFSLVSNTEIEQTVQRLFDEYMRLFQKDGRYKLTPAKRKKAVARLNEYCRDNGCELPVAEQAAVQAMHKLRESEFHWNGGYYDWIDHLFDSREIFQKRLTMKTGKSKPGIAQNAADVMRAQLEEK